MQHDKKLSGGRLNFILARGIGRAFIAKDVNIADVKALLIEAAAA
jgi:3-dehydroquinate synthase